MDTCAHFQIKTDSHGKVRDHRQRRWLEEAPLKGGYKISAPSKLSRPCSPESRGTYIPTWYVLSFASLSFSLLRLPFAGASSGVFYEPRWYWHSLFKSHQQSWWFALGIKGPTPRITLNYQSG